MPHIASTPLWYIENLVHRIVDGSCDWTRDENLMHGIHITVWAEPINFANVMTLAYRGTWCINSKVLDLWSWLVRALWGCARVRQCWIVWDVPGFTTESPAFQELLSAPGELDGWSSYKGTIVSSSTHPWGNRQVKQTHISRDVRLWAKSRVSERIYLDSWLFSLPSFAHPLLHLLDQSLLSIHLCQAIW